MIRKMRIAMTLLLTFASTIRAQNDTAITNAFANFRIKNGANWQIRMNEKTGIPASIHFGQTKARQGKPEDIAKDFLQENRRLFKMKNMLSDLKMAEIQENNASDKVSNHVRFDQYVDGIRVDGSSYYVHIRGDGSIDMVNGDYFPELNINTNPAISKEEALRIAKSGLDPAMVYRENIELLIYPKGNELVDPDALVWQVNLSIKAEPSRRYLINAIDGRIMNMIDLRQYADGTGNTWPKHPGFSEYPFQQVTLKRLDGSGNLQGIYARLGSQGSSCYGPQNYTIYSPSLNFIYQAINWEATCVNIYYHIDKFRTEYWNYYFNFNKFQQIVFNTESGDKTGYDKTTKELYFADGNDHGYTDATGACC